MSWPSSLLNPRINPGNTLFAVFAVVAPWSRAMMAGARAFCESLVRTGVGRGRGHRPSLEIRSKCCVGGFFLHPLNFAFPQIDGEFLEGSKLMCLIPPTVWHRYKGLGQIFSSRLPSPFLHSPLSPSLTTSAFLLFFLLIPRLVLDSPSDLSLLSYGTASAWLAKGSHLSYSVPPELAGRIF